MAGISIMMDSIPQNRKQEYFLILSPKVFLDEAFECCLPYPRTKKLRLKIAKNKKLNRYLGYYNGCKLFLVNKL